MESHEQTTFPAPHPTECCGGILKPCICGADAWEYLDDRDNGDWVEAVYKCKHCKNVIYVELPD